MTTFANINDEVLSLGQRIYTNKDIDETFRKRISKLFDYSDKIALDFFRILGYQIDFQITPDEGVFSGYQLLTILKAEKIKTDKKWYEVPHLNYPTERQLETLILELNSIIITKSNFSNVIKLNQPLRIDKITQEDVDGTYIDSYDFIENKKGVWTFIDLSKLKFTTTSSRSENGWIIRNSKDLINRIKNQNSQTTKMRSSHWEMIYAMARMCNDGMFQEPIRNSILQILSTFMLWINMLNKGSERLNFSRYFRKNDGRDDMFLLRDSNFPIRLSLVAQACYTLSCSDGFQQASKILPLIEKLLIWQCFRRILTVSPKDITNTFSLYTGISGIRTDDREKTTPLNTKNRHSHPVYDVRPEVVFKGPPEWVQPHECTGCSLGNYEATRKLRKKLYDDLFENKIKKSCADLIILFPDIEKEIKRNLIMTPNYNVIRNNRFMVSSLIVPFLKGPPAGIAIEEIKNINAHKLLSDTFRTIHTEDYRRFRDILNDVYTKFIYNCAMIARITPQDVINNIEAYVSNNSASMGAMNIEVELPATRYDKQSTFRFRTTSKKMIVAFATNVRDLKTYYMLTETLQEYKLRCAEIQKEWKKDKSNESKQLNLPKWRRKTVGIREDPGREPRQMYQQDLFTIIAENITCRAIVDGSTGSPVGGYGVDWYGPDRPMEIMTNSMVNQVSMACKICMCDNRHEYFSFSTDASSFDKSSRSVEFFDFFFEKLNEHYVKFHPTDPYMNDITLTLDGKTCTFSKLIEVLRDVYRCPTFEIPGKWSSCALTAAYTNSGSTITFMQNSMTNIANQIYGIEMLNAICMKQGREGLINTVNIVVAGDDAVTTVKLTSGAFDEEFFDKLPEAFEQLGLISGYSLSVTKGAIFGTEVAKLYTVLGMMMNHKATTLNREKRSTASSTVEEMSAHSTLKFLTAERSCCSDDTLTFLNAIGGMRIIQNDDDFLYVCLTSGIVSTIPSSYGGAGLPLFTDMNEPVVTLLLLHGYYQDACLLFGICDMLTEKTGASIRDRLKNAFKSTTKKGVGIEIKSSIDEMEFSSGNLKNFFPIDSERVKYARDAGSKLIKTHGARVDVDTTGLKNVAYGNAQNRAMDMLVSGIPLPVYEENSIRFNLKLANITNIRNKGFSILEKMRKDDPIYGMVIISHIEFEDFIDRYMTPFPCSHYYIHKMTAHYGMKTGRVMSYDYLSVLDRIIGKYSSLGKVNSIPSVEFLLLVLNQNLVIDTVTMKNFFSFLFGLNPIAIEDMDMMQIVTFIKNDQIYAHLSEPSTSMVYISDTILDTLTLIAPGVTRNKLRIKQSLKPVLCAMCRVYGKAIKEIRMILPDSYTQLTKYYSNRLDAQKIIAREDDSHS